MLNIVIPGLFWLKEKELDYNGVDITNWKKLIRRASIKCNTNRTYINTKNHKCTNSDFVSYSDYIYNIIYPQCVGSLAEYLAKSIGVINDYPSFLIAEPTNLRTNRDHLLISEPELLQLNEEEARILINEINLHFMGILRIYYVDELLWLIGLNLDINDNNTNKINDTSNANDHSGNNYTNTYHQGNSWYPIIDIIGSNIDDYLPSSASAIKFIKLFNEIQMLLFNSPVNQMRQSEGLLVVNSIWCWDKILGHIGLHNQLQNIYTNANIFNNIKSNRIKSIDNSNIEECLNNNSLLILDDLYYPYCYQDTYSWLQKITKYEQLVAKPLVKMLEIGKIDKLNIIVPMMPHSNGTIRIQISKYDKYKIFIHHGIQDILENIVK